MLGYLKLLFDEENDSPSWYVSVSYVLIYRALFTSAQSLKGSGNLEEVSICDAQAGEELSTYALVEASFTSITIV